MDQEYIKSQTQSREVPSGRFSAILVGLALGVSVAYLFDANQGRRRRAYLRDQMIGRSHDLRSWRDRVSKNVLNRVWGLYREALMPPNENVDDQILLQRVRSEFGRQVRHPKSIVTTASNGVITLSGPVLSHEVRGLVHCVKRVPGVKKVINNLDVKAHPDRVSGLQGNGPEYLQ